MGAGTVYNNNAAHGRGHGTDQANLYPANVQATDSAGNPTTATTAIWNSYNTEGTITRSSVGLAAPADLDNIFTDGTNYRDMTHLLTTSLELATCGARQYGLYDWLMSSARSVGNLVNTKKIQGSGFEVDPFILAAQKDVIKDAYWIVNAIYRSDYEVAPASGTSLTAAGATEELLTGVASGSNIIKVSVPATGNQPVAANYFVAGQHLFLFIKDATGAAYRLEFEVVQAKGGSAAIQGGAANDYIDIEVTFVGGYGAGNAVATGNGAGDWNASFRVGSSVSVNALSFKLSKSGSGVVVAGSNNVSDFEKWCENRPALNTLKHIPFWYQTSRFTLTVDQFYKEWLERMMRQNTFFQKFGDVPLAERNKQLGLMFQKEWVNQFFWGQPLSGQTLAAYQTGDVTGLEKILSYDPSPGDADLSSGMEGSFMSYRASAVGLYRQLKDTGRVLDLQGAKLNLETHLFDKLFELVRSRKDQGKPADSIDVFTDTRTARQIWRGMINYYKEDGDASGSTMALQWDMAQKSLFGGFYSTSYVLHHPVGVTMNIITNEFFDDILTVSQLGDTKGYLGVPNTDDGPSGSPYDGSGAAGVASLTTSDGSGGRFLMILDLGGGIYPGIVASNRVVHSTGDLDDLAKINTNYSCVMKNPTKEVTLNSQTWTVIVECPTDNLIIENFDNTVPEHGIS